MDMHMNEHDHSTMPMADMHNHGGHDHGSMIREFRNKFFIVSVLTVPVMILSPMIQHWMGVDWAFGASKYILLVLSSIVFAYGGYPFLKGFIDEMKKMKPGMMTLIAIAIMVSYTYSAATVLGLPGMDFFWELCTLILIMLLGHWIEMRSVAGASRDLELLVQLMPDDAHMVMGQMVHDVKTDSLKTGDMILIKPGEKIAADGIIADGESYLNESMLTGESVPVRKQKGDKVIAGSINGNGSLRVTVSHAAKDSYLATVIKLVDEAQKTKSKTQLLADKAAFVLTIVALSAGFATFFFWWLIAKEPISFAITRMVTVMVICCPHALGLAVPLVVAISTSLAAKHGLLIKNRTEFENSRKITTVLFDKTGTLTEGKFQVSRIKCIIPSINEKELIRIAASLEQNSEHPIATGITAKAKELSIAPSSATNFKALTGLGIEADIDGKSILVVGPEYLKEKSITLPQNDTSNAAETIVFILINDQLAGYIALADQVRPESAQAIQTLHQNGIKSILLTGDNAIVAKSVSDELKMDGFFAGVLPDQKLEKIKALQSKGEFIAMTGDGVNDAPALAQANVGIAVGSGSDIAAETAGIILVNSNPADIVSLILFGKATHRKMVQNLVWATGYNVIAIPLAAGVLYKWNIMLSPAVGAVLMSLSTIIVAINAKMLRIK
jgi:Cu2+-exporting ATPase